MDCLDLVQWREPVILAVSGAFILQWLTTGRAHFTVLILASVVTCLGVAARLPLQHYCGI